MQRKLLLVVISFGILTVGCSAILDWSDNKLYCTSTCNASYSCLKGPTQIFTCIENSTIPNCTSEITDNFDCFCSNSTQCSDSTSLCATIPGGIAYEEGGNLPTGCQTSCPNSEAFQGAASQCGTGATFCASTLGEEPTSTPSVSVCTQSQCDNSGACTSNASERCIRITSSARACMEPCSLNFSDGIATSSCSGGSRYKCALFNNAWNDTDFATLCMLSDFVELPDSSSCSYAPEANCGQGETCYNDLCVKYCDLSASNACASGSCTALGVIYGGQSGQNSSVGLCI